MANPWPEDAETAQAWARPGRLLSDHLRRVAGGSAARATCGGREAAYLVGLLHDLGKANPEWQRYLVESVAAEAAGKPRPRGPGHASAGAEWLRVHGGEAARPLALAVLAHHAGLLNDGEVSGTLDQRKATSERGISAAAAAILSEAHAVLGTLTPTPTGRSGEMFTRMLLAALVDADREDAAGEEPPTPQMLPSAEALRDWLRRLSPRHDLDILRQQIQSRCWEAASLSPGFYTLTVPTGGGKTFAGVLWALRHAEAHKLRRIVVALPYTSIIEQNAEALRRAGLEVLEHHHAVAEERRGQHAETWAAPLIITTTVQFFSSLLSAHPGAVRKIHNLQRSVVILDEAQALPTHLLDPLLDVLRHLVCDYGCSVLLTTATQPTFAPILNRLAVEAGTDGSGPREILPPDLVSRAFSELRRVSVEWPTGDDPTPYESVAALVAKERQALVITHLRADAANLWRLLQPVRGDEVLHLSASMCPAHRREVLAEVRRRLEADEAVLLSSTQVVEAGVDVDFPVVFRAMAGLESLAQAAGRCNREGRLGHEGGRFVVFNAETLPPPGSLRHSLGMGRLFARMRADLTAPETFRRYFARLYGQRDLDRHAVQEARLGWRFQAVEEAARLIDEATETVVVPWGDGRALIDRLKRDGPSRWLLRRLQAYTVSVRPAQLARLDLDRVGGDDGVAVARSGYHPVLGLQG